MERENGVRLKKEKRRDRMMRSKSYETHEMREIGWKEAGELRDFPIFLDGNIRRCLPDRRKEMQRPGKIENV